MNDLYCKQCKKQVDCNKTYHKGFNGNSVKEPTKMINGYYHFCSMECLKVWEAQNVQPKEIKSGCARYLRFDYGGVA